MVKCYFANDLKEISNIEELPMIGKGTDGSVYRYNKLALKILNYDNKVREKKGRLDFEKARYFIKELYAKRITFPKDILLDEDGIYIGIVMDYIELMNQNNLDLTQFNLYDLITFMEELTIDFEEQLSPKGVVPNDINFGSYCLTSELFQMCDTDKYLVLKNKSIARDKNKDTLNYTLAKAIYYLDFITHSLKKEERIKWQQWVKQQVKEKKLLKTITSENSENNFENLNEYMSYKRQKVLGIEKEN